MQGCLRYVIKMLGDRLLNYILFDFYKDFLDLCLVVYLTDVTDRPFLFGFLEFLGPDRPDFLQQADRAGREEMPSVRHREC